MLRFGERAAECSLTETFWQCRWYAELKVLRDKKRDAVASWRQDRRARALQARALQEHAEASAATALREQRRKEDMDR